ncbi:DUF1569 domain-containing protein [Dyadobacter pollutisoli]|uniref:DUF1569 domain-containing protein n=1 Tax=Dyadobacter pollutisoli TaxID=2910158 RepID=A0A9E8SMK0_9BACT|nr:DUF1569 domain-containing protein [Dyadobacter pollutisoli]WAC14208.1 DUF1569 domain-containing protein [Dyadobacter pollutisoli]
MQNIFLPETVSQLTERLDVLRAETQPQWGKMNAPQMLAHCNVAYEMAFENKHPRPNILMRLMLQVFAKSTVCGDKPYAKSLQTAPAFIIVDERDFEIEKNRLIGYMKKTVDLGEAHFDGKESLSFGKLTASQWNTMFYKHLNHHLTQFGV